jgi:hypothetical protein
MLPWTIALAVVALAVAGRELLAGRAQRAAVTMAADGGPGTTRVAPDGPRSGAPGPGGRVLTVLLAVVSVVVAVGSLVTVYRVGESGSRAVWTDRFSAQPHRPVLPPGVTPGD